MKKVRNIKERICALILAVLLPLTSVLPGAAVTVQAAETEHTISFYVYEEYTPDASKPSETEKLPLRGAKVELSVGSAKESGESDKDGKVTIGISYDSDTETTGTYSVTKDGFRTVTGATINLKENYDSDSPKEQKMEMSDIAVSSDNVTLEYVADQNVSQTVSITNKIVNTVAGEPGYTWKSANEQVATVKDGTITAAGKGKTEVTVSRFDKSERIKVTVNEKLSGVTLIVSPSNTTFVPGETSVKFTLDGMPADAAKDVPVYKDGEPTSIVTLQKSSNWTAMVGNLNLIGDVKFTAKYPGGENNYLATDIVTDTLNYKQQAQLKLTKESDTVNYGTNSNEGTVPVDSGTVHDRQLTYESSDKDTVSVDANGKYTIHKASENPVTITVNAVESKEYTASSAEYTLTVNKKSVTIKSSDVKWDSAEKVYDGKDTIELTGRINKNTSSDIVFGEDELLIKATVSIDSANASEPKYTTAKITDISVADATEESAAANGNYNISLDSSLTAGATINNLDITVNQRPVYIQINKIKNPQDSSVVDYGISNDDIFAEIKGDYEIGLVGNNGQLDTSKEEGLVGDDTLNFTEYAKISLVDQKYYVGDYTNILKLEATNENAGNYKIQIAQSASTGGSLKVNPQTVDNSYITGLLTVVEDVGVYNAEDSIYVRKDIGNLAFKFAGNAYYDQLVVNDGTKDYTFGKDGGSAIQFSEEGEKELQISLKNTEDLQGKTVTASDNKLTITVDGTNPTVEFSGLGCAGIYTNPSIGFQYFANSDYNVTITPTEEGSGLALFQTKTITIDDDSTMLSNIEAAAVANEGWTDQNAAAGAVTITSSGNHIVLAKVRDHVGNEAVYTSNGLVFEINKPLITIRRDEITDLNDNDSLNFHVDINDRGDENSELTSGIKEVEVLVTDNGRKVEGEDTLNSEGKVVDSYTLTADDIKQLCNISSEDKEGTLAYLLKQAQFTIEGMLSVNKYHTGNIVITVNVTDNAGNTVTEVSQSFSLDTKNPVVTVSYDPEETINGKYVPSRQMNVVFTERNFSEDGVFFDVAVNGEKQTGANENKMLTIAELDAIEGISIGHTDSEEELQQDEYSDERTNTYTIKFANDGAYSIIPYVTDTAGNANDGITYTQENDGNEEFIIDSKNPEVRVSYDNYDAQNGSYFQSRTMEVQFTERNFSESLISFDVEVNGQQITGTAEDNRLTLDELKAVEQIDGEHITVVDSESAETNEASYTEGRTITYTIPFKDGYFKVIPHIKDLSGHENEGITYADSDSAVNEEFCVDSKLPVIKVTYNDEDLTVSNDKYFKDQRVMTITYGERNFDEDFLNFDVVVDGTEHNGINLEELKELAAEADIQVAQITDSEGAVENAKEYTDVRENTLVLTFGNKDKDHDYKIVPYVTDLAGNKNDGLTDENSPAVKTGEEFTVDMVAPVIDVKYTTTYTDSDQNKLTSDITADISTEVQDSMYQNTDIAAQVMITERNFAGGAAFSDGEMVIDETASYVTGEAIESDELAASVTNRADMANVVNNWKDTENEYQKEQTFTFAEDANYTFNLTYTDMAGNTATLDKSGEPHRFTSDESMPEATIEIEETIFDKLADMISFVFFGNQTGKDIKTTVSDDISPVKAGYYKHYPGRDAKGTFDALTEEALIALPDTSWTVFTGKDGSGDNYDANRFAETYSYTVENMEQIVPYEKIEDKAGNTIYINADGVICEDQKSAIKIDINTPAPQTEAFTVEEDDVVYDSDVDFTISVDEAKDDDSVYSGIRYVRYEVRNNGVVTQSGDYNANFEDKTARVEEFSADETVASKLNNSNNVQIFVEVEDWSGNVETLTRDLKIDITDPEISVSFDNNEVSNDKYFGTDRMMTIVYKERNINPEGLTFDFRAGDAELERLTMAELQAVAESSGLTITDGVDTQENAEVTALTDERTLTYKITFTGGSSEDMDYEIIPHIEDQAGRTADADYEDNTLAPEEFTVDKVKPTMAVEYYLVGDGEPEKINVSTDEINRLYKNQTIRAVVKITERNFSPDIESFSDEYEQVVPHFTWTTYSGTPGSVNDFETAAVSRDKWTTESEETFVRVQSFDFVADGDYSFTMEYTDLAGHELETAYDTHYFTVDKTAPEISVVYKADGQVINPGEIETERLFRNKTITADVTITERNFYRSDDAAQFEDGQMNLTYTAVDAYGETVGTSTDADAENPIENYTETANTRSEWQTGSDSEQYVRTHTFTFTKDANYTFALQYTDLAGNAAVDADDSTVTGHPAHYFTVDKTAPTGSIQIRESVWTRLFETVTFGFFTNSSDRVTFTSADKTADVATTQYYRYVPSTESRGRFSGLTVEELDRITDWRTAAPLTLNTEQQVIVYEKIVDRAGNVTYINSREGVVVDKTDADPEITITMADPAHGIYNSNVPFRISVTDPTSGGTYAGLKEVYYEVRKDGSVTQSGNYNSELTDRTQRRKSITKNEVVNARINNSNTVQIWVKAVDWAGNESEVTKDIKIDITDPTISVTYDLNSPLNDRYYNATRTATVVVTERNFDESAVRFDITNTDGTQPSISGWSHSADSGVSDSATHTCRVTFSADGDYTFTLNTTDLAGNDSSYTQVDEFTIDQTDPVIQVSYDNNNDETAGYFNENRTATITVTEHNFNASEVNAMITARLQGSGVSAPGVGGWSTRGDVHTASVTFSEDADYTFDIEYTDLAGNAAAEYTEDSFTVDKTAPEIEFFDIEDKSANKGTVAPGVRYSDVNYTEAGVDITIEGAKDEHSVTALDGERSGIPNGESIKMADFAHTEDNDDVYTMRAVIRDKAGNETEESIIFSVNRFGSTYEFSPETKAFLEKFYTNDPQNIVVTERNVDTLVFNGISYGRDGQQTELTEGEDYTVKASGSEVSWKEYVYDISSDNFQEEGRYNVTIDSEDRAENMMNNKVKGLDIEFVVDKTAPTVVVTGIEEDSYRADTRDMTINVADNTAVATVEVLIDGAVVEEYTQEQIEQVNGALTYTIGNSNNSQDIRVVAVDLAGNEGASDDREVLITSNLFIQYINNTPLLIGSIVAVIAIAGGLIWFFLIFKRRKKDEGQNA